MEYRTLVTYYSRTGTTRDVAYAIRDELRCELEPIVDRTPRDGLLGYIRSGLDVAFDATTELSPSLRSASDYDLVVVGTPIWNASVATPVRTYLAANGEHIRQIAFFCTYGASGSARALQQMQALCGRPPTAMFAVTADAVRHADFGAKVRAFASALTGRTPVHQSSRPVPLRPLHA